MMRSKLCLTLLLFGVGVVVPASLVGQITGQVVDSSGRPLPNAVVVSRTGNGFLATRTDFDGRFVYPGRPHNRGHTIEASSAGFRSTMLRLQGDETEVVLTLLSGGDPGPGWTLGLPVAPRVTITDSSGTPVPPSSLLVDRDYRLVITMRATHCTQASDAVVGERDGDLVVAIAAFTRSGNCPPGEVMISVPHRFMLAGSRTIRVVGRNGDLLVEVAVLASGQPRF